MLENAVKKKIKNKLEKHDNILVQPIESGGTGLGIPDLFIRTKNHDIWMELKRVDWPNGRGKTISIPWRPGQLNWIKHYISLGGLAYLCVYVNKGKHKNTVYFFKNYQILKTYSQEAFESLSEIHFSLNLFQDNMLFEILNRW